MRIIGAIVEYDLVLFVFSFTGFATMLRMFGCLGIIRKLIFRNFNVLRHLSADNSYSGISLNYFTIGGRT